MSKTLTVELENKTIEILELLAKRTSREKTDLVQEALSILFEEYKEIILDT